MVKAIIGLALLVGAVAYGVHWAAEKGTSSGPNVVKVEMPDPQGGGGDSSSGGQIYLP